MVSISSHVYVYWCKNSCKKSYGNSNSFEVKVGMHQGSALSPLLFVIVMEALSTEFRVALPWELLYADDLVVIAETEDDLIKRLNEWKDNMENRGMRVNTGCGQKNTPLQKYYFQNNSKFFGEIFRGYS